jgi:lycopene beta-cyclase
LETEFSYDFAIIGAGAAGMNLALEFSKQSFFDNKKVLIIDPLLGEPIEKKWSFWQKEKFTPESAIVKSWNHTNFRSPIGESRIDLLYYTYYTVEATEFLKLSYDQLTDKPQFEFRKETVVQLNHEIDSVTIETAVGKYTAKHVFDSRVPKEFLKDQKYTHLLQHFKGWVVQFAQPVLDDTAYTMMDFSVSYEDTCSFMYVLPFSKDRALFEFTFFNQSTVSEQVYDEAIKEYIASHHDGIKYKIVAQEQGVIPMSDFPFEDFHQPNVTLIGTGGGWVKPSTGYSFRASQQYAKKLTQRIVNQQPLDTILWKRKGRWYDAIFIEVLMKENQMGPQLFQYMYARNSIDAIFRFLDEESTLLDELKIVLSFPPIPFLKALVRVLFR